MRIITLVLLVGFVAGCSSGPQPPPVTPVLDTMTLMETVLDPSADVVWGSAGQIITAAGTEDLRPTTEEGWANVRKHAEIVSQAGNLLMKVSRAKDDAEWRRLSQAMVDTGAAAMRAAEAKNADQLFQAGADIYSVCSNCHVKYLPAIVAAEAK